ncbi:MAG: D-alanine--D-alanine ligase [Desulfobulbaceae bacterium]|jgi:D-alanine-D-alanine ligase|nr:D-alanine--D-alanine ligase [Desulfobulbaceae bacterium]
MSKKIQLALLAGGKSGEREVSLAGAKGVMQALDTEKYDVFQYDPATDLGKLARDADKLDVAFILLHGLFGEDGTMQGMLDLLGVPYQGAGVLGSAMAMDKDVAKKQYVSAGLPVAAYHMASRGDIGNPRGIGEKLGFPLVVKPIRQGSSLGMSLVHNVEELGAGIELAFTYDSEVMVEQFIKGREITVGVLGNADLVPLPLVEVIPGEAFSFFDYTAKYTPGATTEICPAQVPQEIWEKAQEYGVRAHRALKLRGYSRTDMIFNEAGEIFVIETNTIPGMTPTSLLPQAARAHGLDFSALLDRLIALAME